MQDLWLFHFSATDGCISLTCLGSSVPKLLNFKTPHIRSNGDTILQEAARQKSLKRGLLIAIEGIDGAGKTTQTSLLLDRLKKNGYLAVALHEPTDGKWGQKIRELAKSGRHNVTPEEELDFFYQDRIEDVELNIKPALAGNKIVIMDRYYFSSIAYQGIRGLDVNKIEEMNQKIAPKPDILIILDIKPAVSLQRIRRNRDNGPNEFEKTKHLEQSRDIFLKQFSNRAYTRIIEGNGRRSPEEVSRNIWLTVEPIILGNTE
jgi:dTMP kinase